MAGEDKKNDHYELVADYSEDDHYELVADYSEDDHLTLEFYLVKLLISPITNAIYMLVIWIYGFLDFLIIENIKDNKWLFLFYLFGYVLKFFIYFLISLIGYVYLNCKLAFDNRPSLIWFVSLALFMCYLLSGPLWYYVAIILSFVTNDPYNVINGLLINFVLFSPLGMGLSFNIFNSYFVITLVYVFIPSVITNLFVFDSYFNINVILPNQSDNEYTAFSYALIIVFCVSSFYFGGVFFGLFNLFDLSYFLNLVLVVATALIVLKNCEKIEHCNFQKKLHIDEYKFYLVDNCFYKKYCFDPQEEFFDFDHENFKI